MAPPRKHSTDAILDAARALVLRSGPRAASVAAIAAESRAPVGTLYHRFGSRDAILAAAWLRALERFQQRALEAAGTSQDAVEIGAAMAASTIAFAAAMPEDARLLLDVRRDDLLDGGTGAEVRARLDEINAPLEAAVGGIARQLSARADARSLDAVSRAVVDLPYAALRRHGRSDRLPSWLEADVRESARALLERI
jgi:AcrR family transcriptional regulator